jgi:glycosyltransferase involved in cell wall biosynthesis
MRTCLWLARAIPFPLTSGDRIYTAKLAQAFAATGVSVSFLGLAGEAPPEPVDNIVWHLVPGKPRGRAVSLLSTMPLVGARHATSQYKAALDRLLRNNAWDFIVVDQYGMGWVLAYRRLFSSRGCAIIFIGHDHEESITYRQWNDARGLPERLYLLQNYLKTRRSERRTARGCDLVTTITEVDAELFGKTAPGTRAVTLTPGYDGPRLPQRQITASTPRVAVMFGSYRWSAKQTNLKLFLDHVHARMQRSGIAIRIVGDIDDDLRTALAGQYPATQFTGFVADPAPHLDARLAIVAETIGGGFKLKLLDYIFNRIPIIALDSCVAGLPEPVRRHLTSVPDLTALGDEAAALIDDFVRLDAMQRGAFAAAERAFDWRDRGEAMRAAVDVIGYR